MIKPQQKWFIYTLEIFKTFFKLIIALTIIYTWGNIFTSKGYTDIPLAGTIGICSIIYISSYWIKRLILQMYDITSNRYCLTCLKYTEWKYNPKKKHSYCKICNKSYATSKYYGKQIDKQITTGDVEVIK